MITMIIRAFAMHRIPKTTFLVLWGLAILRLLVPFQFSISVPASVPDTSAISAYATESRALIEMPAMPHSETPSASGSAETPSESMNTAIVLLIWAVIAVGLFIFFVINHVRYRKSYRLAVPIENEYISRWQSENVLKRRRMSVKACADISTPLTYGLFQPIILLPKTIDWENYELLQYVLTHELMHIKRFDILWKWLLMAAVCAHWFNPLVWAMYVLANRDMEIICDEKVVRVLGKNRKKEYALTLLELTKKKDKLNPLVSAFSKNAIEERITAIMKSRKTHISGIAVAIVLILGVTSIATASGIEIETEIVEKIDSEIVETGDVNPDQEIEYLNGDNSIDEPTIKNDKDENAEHIIQLPVNEEFSELYGNIFRQVDILEANSQCDILYDACVLIESPVGVPIKRFGICLSDEGKKLTYEALREKVAEMVFANF